MLVDLGEQEQLLESSPNAVMSASTHETTDSSTR